MIRSICLLEAIGLPWGYYGTSGRAELIWLLCWGLIITWCAWAILTLYNKFVHRRHNNHVNQIKAGLAPLLEVPVSDVELTMPLQRVGGDKQQ